MDKLTKEEYDYLKQLQAEGAELYPEEIVGIEEYEKSGIEKPTRIDVLQAERNPDSEEAQEILKQNKKYEAIFGSDKSKTRRIEMPQINTEGFTFNWPAAYEAETGKQLIPGDMESAKALNTYLNNKMYQYENNGNLQRLAYDMHLYDGKEDWTDFLKTDNGQRFKEFLKDASKYQNDKELEKIWEDGTVSNAITKLLTPVAREYAKQNYNDIDVGSVGGYLWDMKAPLAFDVGSQVAMMGPGRFVGKPIVNGVINNMASPIITEAGQVIMNDKPVGTALGDATVGVLTNFATPAILQRGTNQAAKIGSHGFKEGALAEQAAVNAAANKAASIEKRLKKGEPYISEPINDNVTSLMEVPQPTIDFYGSDNVIRKITQDLDKGKTISKGVQNKGPIITPEEYKGLNKVITKDEMNFYNQNAQLIHGRKKNFGTKMAKDIAEDASKNPYSVVNRGKANDALAAKKKSLDEHGDLSGLTPEQLVILNHVDHETVVNYIGRKLEDALEDNPSLANYIVNLLGKPQIGQRLYRQIPFVGDYGVDKNEKKFSPYLESILKYDEVKKEH